VRGPLGSSSSAPHIQLDFLAGVLPDVEALRKGFHELEVLLLGGSFASSKGFSTSAVFEKNCFVPVCILLKVLGCVGFLAVDCGHSLGIPHPLLLLAGGDDFLAAKGFRLGIFHPDSSAGNEDAKTRTKTSDRTIARRYGPQVDMEKPLANKRKMANSLIDQPRIHRGRRLVAEVLEEEKSSFSAGEHFVTVRNN